MGHRPRITIGIPTRNRAQILRRTIENVLEQSFTDFELFVSDNASTDDTAAVVDAIDDPRVHLAPLEQNIGLYPNFTRTLQLGTAPLAMTMPDDGPMLPGNLARKVAYMDQHPDVDMVHSGFIFEVTHPDGRVEVRERMNHVGRDDDHVLTGAEVVRRLLGDKYAINTNCAVFRRHVVADERFDPAEGNPADLGFIIRAAHKSRKVGFIADPLMRCTLGPNDASASNGVFDYVDGGYQMSMRAIGDVQTVRNNFINRFGDEIDDLDEIKAGMRAWAQRELWRVVQREALPDRSARGTWDTLLAASRIEPTMLASPKGARFLAASLVGERGRKLVN